MSFRTIEEEELRQAAEAFGIEVAPNVPAESIADLLDEEGATYERWVELKKHAGLDEEEEPVVEEVVEVKTKKTTKKKTAAEKVDDVLVKMDRKNQRFEAYGKVFTAKHPYVICDAETANRIFSTFDGFRTAHPSEAESYYS